MALVNMDAMLKRARKEKYAVGAFDLINLEFAEAILQGAIAQRAPVILSVAAVHFDYVNLESLAPSLVKLAEAATIPVALHLDHGTDLEMAVNAIRLGFSSVMIDAALKPFGENVAITREVVRVAHAVGVTVEGELGYVGGHEGADHDEDADSASVVLDYTDVESARRYFELTGVDCLAVSVGTVHGLFKTEPRIDFNRLRAIRDAVPIPLVIHGGSGLTEAVHKEMVEGGMCKVNLYSELSRDAVSTIRDALSEKPDTSNITWVLGGVRQAVQKVVEYRIRLWGSSGKG